jgi:hypothetical protein
MRKEVLWAIVGGSILGLVIAFGIWRANSALRNSSAANISPSPSGNPKREFGITLAKPEDNDVVTDSPITFSGVTSPEAWIAVSTDSDDYIFQAGTNGTFSHDIKLSPAVNQITISAYKDGGKSASTSLLLVYSSEFAKTTPAASSPKPGTGEANIRQKVIQKVEEVLKKPTAYLGTVTDIAAGTLQIKNDASEIQQISTLASGLAVIKIGKTNKEIKLADIAIGDFIVAMGYKNGNNVLNAQRILSTSPLGSSLTASIYGTISAIDKKTVSISSLTNGQESTLTYDKNTKTNTPFAKVEEGDLVVLVFVKDTQKARTIYIIKPASPSPSASPKPSPTAKPSATPK